ncbi:MAG: hypothetical protein ACTSSP_09375, partial [Candidatus Asgardarchaeia archaeon]
LQYVGSPNYYEPGFNIMFPLEITSPKADRFYILIRKRLDEAETQWEDIQVTDFSISVTDASNGEDVEYSLITNSVYGGWNDDPSGSVPLVLDVINSIDLSNPTVRVRAIDCYIRDTTDNDFIKFRVLVNDEDKYFHYIPVKVTDITNRSTYTSVGRDVYVRIESSSDYYVLFSPYAYLAEAAESQSDFSYPLNSIFYKRQTTFNDENYSFSISSYSHSFIQEVISVMNVPNFHKAGVILIDNIRYKYLISGGENAYVDIAISGQLSGISDTFRVNFTT